MAKLINGNGNKAIWAAQDADLIASICGNVTAIAAVGSQFSYTKEDANTLGVADGVIITKEGRRIQLDTGDVDLFTIPTGTLGIHSYYIIGYKLIENEDSSQTCETFVQKMDNATDVIPEDTFKGGATEVYVSLYRIDQDGMTIDTVDLLLPMMNNLNSGGGGMPQLDFANPLHTFSSGNLSYTADRDCYLVGSITNKAGSYSDNKATITIDNTVVYGTRGAGTNLATVNVEISIPITKIANGSAVVVNYQQPQLHIFEAIE